MEKICKELRSRVHLLMDNANRIGKKYDKGYVMRSQRVIFRVNSINNNKMNDRDHYSEKVGHMGP